MKKINQIKQQISSQNRKRKFDLALSCIKENDEIIDIGVDPTLGGNTNYFEKWYSLPNKLTCLGVKSDFTNFKKEFPNFNLIEFDGTNFPKFEKKFDFAFSNAVIEHVGDSTKQVEWVYEISRITNILFITTPNRWLPFETHSMTFFIHWLPIKLRNYIYRRIGKKAFAENYMWLLGQNDFKKILTNGGFDIISFQKNKFLFFTIDFVAICRSKEI